MSLLGKIMVKLGLDSSEFQKGTKAAEAKIGGFANYFKGIGGQIAATAAAAFSIGAIINFAKEATGLAAKAEGVKVAFDKLNNPSLLDDLRRATLNSVDDLQLMQRALQAKNFKIPLDQLATYLAFATKRAQETGMSVDYLVDSIVTGLGRQSVLILDNLGISANEIRTQMEKSGSMAAAVGEIIRRDMGGASGAIETAAIKTGQLSAAWTNFMIEVGKTGTVNSLKTGFTTMLSDFTSAMKSESMTGLDKFLVFTGIDRSKLLKYNDELERTAKATKEAEAASDGMMESIKSVEQAQRMLNSLTADDNRVWVKLFKGKLESYIIDERAAKQQQIWRNNSINGIKQQIEELKKLRDEEVNSDRKQMYAKELKILDAKLVKEEAIYNVKKETEKIGPMGSISFAENDLKALEAKLKLVITDQERERLQSQIEAKKLEIKAMVTVEVPKSEREVIEQAIKQYEDMQLSIPIGFGTLEEVASAQQEWDRLAGIIKQAKDEFEKFPKMPEVTPPKGSLAAFDAALSKLSNRIQIAITQEERMNLTSQQLEMQLRKTFAETGGFSEAGIFDAYIQSLDDLYNKMREADPVFADFIARQRDLAIESKNTGKDVIDMGSLISSGITQSMQGLGDALASGDMEAMLAQAILIPMCNMMSAFGAQLIALGIGASALKELMKNPYLAIAAGAALVALAAAGTAMAQNLVNNTTGGGSGANSNSFTGGYSTTGSDGSYAMKVAPKDPEVVVLSTKVSGSDILFVSDKEKMRRRG